MTVLEQQSNESAPQPDVQAAPSQARKELTDWQAQLLALGITIGLLSVFMVIFSLLTGSM